MTALELEHAEQELRDTIEEMDECDRAEAEHRVVNYETWLNRYHALHDRFLQLERKVEALRNATGATETRRNPST